METKNVDDRNMLRKYLSIAGLIIIIIWGGFWIYCFHTTPRTPIPEQNHIYAVNYHGTEIYLTGSEYITLYAIPGTALLFGVISALVMKYRKRNINP